MSAPASHRLPPYGAEADRRLRCKTRTVGGLGCLWVAVGQRAWRWAGQRAGHLRIVVPPGEDPTGFRWRLAARCTQPVLLIDCGATRPEIYAAAAALIRDGAHRVLVVPSLERHVRQEPDHGG